MTKPLKCDCCRLRKVKCDEGRPICGVCLKGGRVCTYTYGKSSRWVVVEHNGERVRRAAPAQDVSPEDVVGGMLFGTSPPPPLLTSPRDGEAEEMKDNSSQAMLSLRSTREAKDGNGLFQTFVPLCPEKAKAKARSRESVDTKHRRGRQARSQLSPSPQTFITSPDSDDKWTTSCRVLPSSSIKRRPTSSPKAISPLVPSFLQSDCSSEKMAARWTSLVGSGDPDDAAFCPMYIFGDWVGLVAPHIKESDAVRAAAACLMDSAVAYVTRSEQNLNAARKSNAEALRTIRIMIQAGDPRVPHNDILIAIKLLNVVEQFLGVHTQNYRYHAAGLVNLLQGMCRHGKQYDAISQHIFYASFIADATSAILGGRDSVFDDVSWLDIPPPQTSNTYCPRPEHAWRYIMRTFIRVPRLVRLVRTARQSPNSVSARKNAHSLATELFETTLEQWVQEITDKGAMTWHITHDEEDLYGSDAYHFASPRLFILLTTYWMTRIFICGCVQALCDMAPLRSVEPLSNLEAARDEDIRAATDIARCAHYALKTSPLLPVVSLRLQMPVLISFGAWHRLETRELAHRLVDGDTSSTSATGTHATHMKTWCVRLSRDISSRWNGVFAGVPDMEEKTDSLSGGPLRYK